MKIIEVMISRLSKNYRRSEGLKMACFLTDPIIQPLEVLQNFSRENHPQITHKKGKI